MAEYGWHPKRNAAGRNADGAWPDINALVAEARALTEVLNSVLDNLSASGVNVISVVGSEERFTPLNLVRVRLVLDFEEKK